MFSKDKADCPFWRGPCKEHQCRLYIQVIGMNPNTGEQMNKYGCAFEFLPVLMIENSQQQRQTGASVDAFRNEMAQANGLAAIQMQIANAPRDEEPKLISQ